MSSFSKTRDSAGRVGRSIAGAAMILGVALTLSGCTGGFTPMHASVGTSGTLLSERLRGIEIATIPGRVGQQLRNELIFGFTGGSGSSGPQLYRLEIAISERTTSALVSQTNIGEQSAVQRNYNLSAEFQLVRAGDNVVLFRGKSLARAALQRFDSVYANVRALRDAQDRAARTVATDLKVRIEAFLAGTGS